MADLTRRSVITMAPVLGGAALLAAAGGTADAAQAGDEPRDGTGRDFAGRQLEELSKITNQSGFCEKWKESLRGIAIAAQAILKWVYPQGAIVLGFLIEIADEHCAEQ